MVNNLRRKLHYLFKHNDEITKPQQKELYNLVTEVELNAFYTNDNTSLELCDNRITECLLDLCEHQTDVLFDIQATDPDIAEEIMKSILGRLEEEYPT